MKAAGLAKKSKLHLTSSGALDGPEEGMIARQRALEIVEEQLGELPSEAHDFDSFETIDGLVRVEAVTLTEMDIWSLRYATVDPNFPDRELLVEITSLIDESQSHLSCRVSQITDGQVNAAGLDAPAILKRICAEFRLTQHGIELSPKVQLIGADTDVTEMLKQLTMNERWWNVHVVSASDEGRGVIDAFDLHSCLIGCANTFLLPEHHELEFAAAVGYDFNIVPGGVRTFRPGFNVMSSEIPAHPLTRPPMAGDDAGDLIDRIVQDSFRVTVERRNIRFAAPSFVMVKQFVAQKFSEFIKSSGSATAQIEALERLVIAERRNADEAVSLAIQSDEERQSTQDALANEQAINHSLRARVAALEAGLREAGASAQTVDPKEYSEIKAWVNDNLSGKLRLTPRAEKGLRNARYENIEDVVSGLRLLAGPYHEMKTGQCDPDAFVQACNALGMEETRSVSRIAAGQQGEDYFVLYAGKRQFLDRHLKKGISKDPRNCLRIYFFWDAENETVVVGSLPEHLNTSGS